MLARQAAVLDEVSDDLGPADGGARRPAPRRQAAAAGLLLLGLARRRRRRLPGDRDGRRLARAVPGGRADPRRRDGRQRHPPRAARPCTAGSPRCTAATAGSGSSEAFGVAGAILAGDLCLSWCDEMYAGSGPAGRGPAARPGGLRPDAHRADVRAVPRHARVDPVDDDRRAGPARHPLQVGQVHRRAAAAARRRPGRAPGPSCCRRTTSTAARSARPSSCATTCSACSATPATTGKPAGDDLREGKRTVLVALTLERCSPAQAAQVRAGLGDPQLGADGRRRRCAR